MNPRLRSILVVIGILTFAILAIVLIPRGLSLYYQSRGGQHIDYVLRSVEGIEELVCEPLPEDNLAAIDEVNVGVEDLQKAVRLNRNNAQAHYYLGKAYCLFGWPEEAVKAYHQYTELRPANPLGFIGLGFAYESLGDAENSRRTWLEAGLEAHQFNAAGDERFKLEDYEGAIKWYERAIRVDAESAEAWDSLGKSYAAIHEIENSIQAFEAAWDLDADVYVLNYARMLIASGEPESAAVILNDSLQQYKNSRRRLDWWKELNDIYYSRNQWSDAEIVLSQALQEFSDDPDLHISLGWVNYNLGKGFDVAKEQFELAIDLLSTGGRGFAALAELYSKEQRYEEADLLYQQAIERAPSHRWYYLDRGDNARLAGNYAVAEEIYLDAIERFPNFARGYFQLAWVYHLQGNDEAAVDAISTSLELLESPVENYFLRAGDLYRFTGQRTKALEAYYQVLSINPDNQAAIEGIELLDPGQ